MENLANVVDFDTTYLNTPYLNPTTYVGELLLIDRHPFGPGYGIELPWTLRYGGEYVGFDEGEQFGAHKCLDYNHSNFVDRYASTGEMAKAVRRRLGAEYVYEVVSTYHYGYLAHLIDDCNPGAPLGARYVGRAGYVVGIAYVTTDLLNKLVGAGASVQDRRACAQKIASADLRTMSDLINGLVI